MPDAAGSLTTIGVAGCTAMGLPVAPADDKLGLSPENTRRVLRVLEPFEHD